MQEPPRRLARLARLARRAALVAGGLAAACGSPRAPGPGARPARVLHTFGPEESELVGRLLAERGVAIDASRVPFARGQQVIGEILRAGAACPALIRVDATWLPELVRDGLLAPPPAALTGLDWLPEAAALARAPDGAWWALPQTVDGLVVVRRADAPAPADDGLDALLSAARAAPVDPGAAAGPAGAPPAARRWPLGLRADGYWLVPWLRAAGAELGPPTDGEFARAEDAVARFAALFGDLAPPPPPPGGELPDEVARWRAGAVGYWVAGPWQLGALPTRDELVVSALRHAPRGGHLLVVPRCAAAPDEGWRVAAALTAPEVQVALAARFASVPTRRAALDASPALVRALHAALAGAEPLPWTPLTPRLFDDLGPALAAVVGRDATAAEAMAGVRRGWARLAAAEGRRAAPGAPAPGPGAPR